LLTEQDMRFFISCYVQGDDDPADPRISPLRNKDLRGAPPALVLTAGYDPLRDEGEAYARSLEAAGVPVVRRRYDGMFHGFFGLVAALDDARDALELVGTELRRAFGTLPA
jgi:acetyl esterase